jgi:hypothetical protein
LRRNIDISVRKAENMSVARSVAMSKQTIEKYFTLLDTILTDNELYDKPGNIYNVDETGLQLNTRAGMVLAENAEGFFLPPYCIFKGKNKNDELSDGMPPGSAIRMNKKSAYVNSDIFFDWLKFHFLPRKMPGKVLLIVDGHTSHTNNLEMLQFSEEKNIILLCLPPHTTHYLQPLDRGFFKSLKIFYYDACRRFIKGNTGRKLKRVNFGKLLGCPESYERFCGILFLDIK